MQMAQLPTCPNSEAGVYTVEGVVLWERDVVGVCRFGGRSMDVPRRAAVAGRGLMLQPDQMRLYLPHGAFAASSRATHLRWLFCFAQPRAVSSPASTSRRAPAFRRRSTHLS